MNTSSSELNNSDIQKESSHMMRFGRQQVQSRAVYLSLVILSAFLSFVINTLGVSFQQSAPQPSVAAVQHQQKSVLAPAKHDATDYLIDTLKQYGLWNILPFQEVPRFFIGSYPYDLDSVADISIKKKVFLHSLLPHALFVRQETLRKRNKLQVILNKIDCLPEDIDFVSELDDESGCSWSDSLTGEEVSFIQKLSSNYRTTTAEGLLERVDAVPTSIILAQGALESSWGSSRFTREGNSVFGMWTWDAKGIVPLEREEGKTHKVKVYDTILDAVRAYQLTLNRLDPYDQFRQLRIFTDDPLILVDGLNLYSERGEEYVEEIKSVILSNDLQKYDSNILSGLNMPELLKSMPKPDAINEHDKSSL